MVSRYEAILSAMTIRVVQPRSWDFSVLSDSSMTVSPAIYLPLVVFLLSLWARHESCSHRSTGFSNPSRRACITLQALPSQERKSYQGNRLIVTSQATGTFCSGSLSSASSSCNSLKGIYRSFSSKASSLGSVPLPATHSRSSRLCNGRWTLFRLSPALRTPG
jgi:hypothetical protein